MQLEDPIKEMNKLKYLNNVAMKSRYDMLLINKYILDNGIKASHTNYHRNYPSPCRDYDLLAYKVQMSNKSLHSYVKHIKQVNDSISKSKVLGKLDSIDQTSAINTKQNRTIESKKPTWTISSDAAQTIDIYRNKTKKQRQKKRSSTQFTDCKVKSNYTLRKVKKNKLLPIIKVTKTNKCMFPTETTPFMCTEPVMDIRNKSDTEPDCFFDSKVNNNSNANYPKVLLSNNNIKKGEKLEIRLSKLLNQEELINDNDINTSPKNKKEDLSKSIKIKQGIVCNNNNYSETESKENQLPFRINIKKNTTLIKQLIPDKYKHYDNFLKNLNDNIAPYPKHSVYKNYLFKQNTRALMKTDKQVKLLDLKISNKFKTMHNEIISIIDNHNNTEDLY